MSNNLDLRIRDDMGKIMLQEELDLVLRNYVRVYNEAHPEEEGTLGRHPSRFQSFGYNASSKSWDTVWSKLGPVRESFVWSYGARCDHTCTFHRNLHHAP